MKKKSLIICDLKTHIVLLGIGILLLAALSTDDKYEFLSLRTFIFITLWILLHVVAQMIIIVNEQNRGQRMISMLYSDHHKDIAGIVPRWRHEELRMESIRRAIDRYCDAGREIPDEWLDEMAELLSKHAQVNSKTESNELSSEHNNISAGNGSVNGYQPKMNVTSEPPGKINLTTN